MGITSSSYVPKYKASEYTKRRPGKNIYNIDGKNVYWRGRKINADGKTFENLTTGYGKDINNIYWSGKIIDISPNEKTSFKSLKYYYAKSKQNVYYKGYIINADPKSFRINKYNEIIYKKYYKDGKKYKNKPNNIRSNIRTKN